MYYTYILLCADDTLYTGITNDLEHRLVVHKSGKGGKYTRAHGAVAFIYTERKKNRSFASKREAEIKKLSRTNKLALCKSRKNIR